MPTDRHAAELAELAALHQELPRNGLVVATSGNVSVRLTFELMAIKPSGVAYDRLDADAMVITDLSGRVMHGSQLPSSDTGAHAYIYRHRPDVNAVVHTHSTYACAWAAAGRPVPCLLTMMADEFGGDIPIGPFAPIGDDSIGRAVVETLRDSRSPAVILTGHGVFSIGHTGAAAVKAAILCEEAAKATLLAHQLGPVRRLPAAVIDALHERYRTDYGQPRADAVAVPSVAG